MGVDSKDDFLENGSVLDVIPKIHHAGALDRCEKVLRGEAIEVVAVDVNDSYGHEVGDSALRHLSSIIKKQVEIGSLNLGTIF